MTTEFQLTALAAAATISAACGGGGGPDCAAVADHVSTKLAEVHFFDEQADAKALAARCESERWSADYRKCVHGANDQDGLLDCIDIQVRDDRKRELEAAKHPPPVPTLELSATAPVDGSGASMGYAINLPPETETKMCGMGGCVHTIPISDEHSYIISVGAGDGVTDLATAKRHAPGVVIPPRTITKAEEVGGDFLITFGDDPIWSKFVYYKKLGDSYRYTYCRGPLPREHMELLASMCFSLRPSDS